MTTPSDVSKVSAKSQNGSALMVAAGIFLSRIAGLVRERVFAHYFGNSDSGDAFKAALKIPNFLQNLFGEGVLSASFIPVYASLISKNDKEEAGRLAGTIASILALFVAILVLLGVWLTPFLIDTIAPGFHGGKRLLTINLVQIFFPGTGLLVMSAWCLGILNSHRKFFLSYAAPVLWNLSIIGAILLYGGASDQSSLSIKAAWGLVLGSLLQFLVQLPTALKLVSNLKLGFQLKLQSVKTVIKNFFPVVTSRGVVQVSAYIDNVIASLLPTGAVSALAYAQVLYLLPVSLFGMAISVAELPNMSQARGTKEEINSYLKMRLSKGLRQIAFFIVPSITAFLALGDVVVGAIFQTGAFNHDSTLYVWGVLAGSTIGLLATTLGRLYASTFYALRDTRTPLKFALVRVFLTTILGYFFALKLPQLLNINISWGTAGLTASAGLAGWIEFLLLRRKMNKLIGNTGLDFNFMARIWCAAVIGAAVSLLLKISIQAFHPILKGVFVLGTFGAIYFVLTYFLKIQESSKILRKLKFKVVDFN
jgi:putative peptidoglycan lipid II flippase